MFAEKQAAFYFDGEKRTTAAIYNRPRQHAFPDAYGAEPQAQVGGLIH